MMRRRVTFTRNSVAVAATAGLLASLTSALAAAPANANEALSVTGAATIGVSRIENGARVFYLASAYTDGGGTVTRVVFGNADDVPTLVPNAAGQCEPAVYRNSNATFYQASASVNGGGTVTATQFGNAGDRPVQNASGTNLYSASVVAVRRPSNGTFYFRIDNPEENPPVSVSSDQFGDPADVGLNGRQGSGVDVGVYRPSNSTFYFQDPSQNSATPATSQQFGSPGDQGLIGAFASNPNFDRPEYVGVFRASQGRWFLAQRPITNDGSRQAPQTEIQSFTFGSPGDTALACDNAPQG